MRFQCLHFKFKKWTNQSQLLVIPATNKTTCIANLKRTDKTDDLSSYTNPNNHHTTRSLPNSFQDNSSQNPCKNNRMGKPPKTLQEKHFSMTCWEGVDGSSLASNCVLVAYSGLN